MSAEFAETQHWDVERYATDGRFVADLAGPVLALLDARAGERILDLGCGDGRLSAQLTELGVNVVGIDSSAAMVAAAAKRGVDSRRIDAQALAFDGEFDAVFSNAALHWMPEADAVADGVFAALKPGGRFVAEMGGHGNLAAIRIAIRSAIELVTGATAPDDNKLYPTPEAYTAVLNRAGFAVDRCDLVPRPTPLPTGLKGWIETFAGRLIGGFDAGVQESIIAAAERLAAPDLRDDEGRWTADYVRLRFKATKP